MNIIWLWNLVPGCSFQELITKPICCISLDQNLNLPSGEERDGTDEESSDGLTVNDEDGGIESFHESSFREECNSC